MPHSSRPAARARSGAGLGPGRADLAEEGAQRAAELQRPAGGVAVPERHLPGLAGGGGDQHPVVGDLLDPPGRRPEQEDVADPRLVDHLLVELAHPTSARPLASDDEDAEQAAVGDGAAAGDREPLRAAPGGEGVGDPVPRQPRAELGEGVGGVPAGQHVEHRVQRRLRQRRRTAPSGGPARRPRRPCAASRRRSRRSAGPARRAGCAGSGSTRSRRPSSARRPARTARGRRGTWGTGRRG